MELLHTLKSIVKKDSAKVDVFLADFTHIKSTSTIISAYYFIECES